MTTDEMTTDDRIEQARLLYERAIFNGENAGLDAAEPVLDAVEADLALARGRIVHARYLARRNESPAENPAEDPSELPLFERAARLYGTLRDGRGEGEALFWVGCFHQVVRQDDQAAVPALERSAALAQEAGDRLTLSYALRHLGFAEHTAGRLDAARERLEESTRLRREIGMLPGVAANLLGLAYVAAAQDRPQDATALLAEAAEVARASGAHGITRYIDEARTELASPR